MFAVLGAEGDGIITNVLGGAFRNRRMKHGPHRTSVAHSRSQAILVAGDASTEKTLSVSTAQLRAKTSSTFVCAFAPPSISLGFSLAGDIRQAILS